MKISLVLVKSQRLTVASASISILVEWNCFCHFSRTLIPSLMVLIAWSGFYLKMRLISILALTLSQISFEMLSSKSSIFPSFWLM